MKIVVIGLGSMGKRRIRLIKELFPLYDICGVDSREDRQKEAKDILGINSFNQISDVPKDVECAFVCTSPLSHASIIKECLNNKWNVFTEINLVDDDYEDNIELAKANDCKLFLSSTFLYREETRFIRSRIDHEHRWNYVYHIGQYLPDWHPWEKIGDYFIGNKRTNGCREILAIELPWLIKTFGTVSSVESRADKITDLAIDYNDNYCIQVTHENGNKGMLIVDVVNPIAVRLFHAYTEGKYISWDGTPDSLYEYDNDQKTMNSVQLVEDTEHLEGYSSFIVENAYKNEIKAFFNVVNDNMKAEYGFIDDLVTLKVIDSIGA